MAMFRSTVKRLLDATVFCGRPATLKSARRSDFFTFFCLEEAAAPELIDSAHTWHRFRPQGPNFRPMVELAVLTDQAGRIAATHLGLDRAFIDHPSNRVFARDVAKSYLLWALPKPLDTTAGTLVANIADLRGSTTLIAASAPKAPPADLSGGYRVFCGDSDRIRIALPKGHISLTNFDGALPDRLVYAATPIDTSSKPQASPQRRWLGIDVVLDHT